MHGRLIEDLCFSAHGCWAAAETDARIRWRWANDGKIDPTLSLTSSVGLWGCDWTTALENLLHTWQPKGRRGGSNDVLNHPHSCSVAYCSAPWSLFFPYSLPFLHSSFYAIPTLLALPWFAGCCGRVLVMCLFFLFLPFLFFFFLPMAKMRNYAAVKENPSFHGTGYMIYSSIYLSIVCLSRKERDSEMADSPPRTIVLRSRRNVQYSMDRWLRSPPRPESSSGQAKSPRCNRSPGWGAMERWEGGEVGGERRKIPPRS